MSQSVNSGPNVSPPPGWTEWDRDGRKDGIRSFDLKAGDCATMRVHVEAGGRSNVVISPMGIRDGTYPIPGEAFVAAERRAVERARNTIKQARREIADAEAALAYMGKGDR